MSRQTRRDTTRVERAATAGVVALAAGSFALSYDALHRLADANQVPKPLAWIGPLIVDGFIIVATLAILHAVQHGRTARYPWSLLVAFSALSVAFNVLHAPPTAITRLVAAIPPLTLVLSFELLMRQLRNRVTTAASTTRVTASQTADRQSPTQRLRAADPRVAVDTAGRSLLQRAREIHEQHQNDGVKLTGKTLGHILGISDGSSATSAQRQPRPTCGTEASGTRPPTSPGGASEARIAGRRPGSSRWIVGGLRTAF